MKMLSKFPRMERDDKQRNSEYSIHIILQCITSKPKYMFNMTSSDKTSEMLLRM